MKFATIVLAAVVLAASVQASCFTDCEKNGGSYTYCSAQCYDRACHRICTKDGGSWQYCQEACRT
ncbi:hypothetical protein BGZ82_000376 [Podila clonocystis]|nr:hypothetical protein BGZ82_000376 [Podila clonocystis]